MAFVDEKVKEIALDQEKRFDEWCKRHDICAICVTGGYNCDSDHK